MNARNLSLWALALALSGCDPSASDDLLVDREIGDAPVAEQKTDHLTIPFETFNADIGAAGLAETRKIFASAYGYRAYFGVNPPSTVDFSTHYVVFYSAGVKSTGGYRASIKRVQRSETGYTVFVTTSLESPGADCMVTMALTKPYALAKFRKPYPRPYYVRYYRSDTVRSCSTSTGPTCASNADCAAYSDYCDGCRCRAVSQSAPAPMCLGTIVNCFADPCLTKTAACVSGRCTVVAR